MREILVSLSGDGEPGEGMPVIEITFPDKHVKKRELLIVIKALKLGYRRKVREYRKILISENKKAGEDNGTNGTAEVGSGSSSEESKRTDATGERDAGSAQAAGGAIKNIASSSGSGIRAEQTTQGTTGLSKAEEIRRRVGSQKPVERKHEEGKD